MVSFLNNNENIQSSLTVDIVVQGMLIYVYLYIRYVNGHAKKHFEEVHCSATGQKKTEKFQQHSVCMDCSSYSTFWYV